METPVLSYPAFHKDFILETDASAQGLGAIFSQQQEDGQVHPVAYTSRVLSPSECNLKWRRSLWYGLYHIFSSTILPVRPEYTDRTAVKAVLEAPNPNGKHARWWIKVYGQGVRDVKIIYRSGKCNANADALSRGPQSTAPQEASEPKVQVAAITTDKNTITNLLQADAIVITTKSLRDNQQKDQIC